VSAPTARPAVFRVVAWGAAVVAVAAGGSLGLRTFGPRVTAARRAGAQAMESVASSPAGAEAPPAPPPEPPMSAHERALLERSWLDSESIAPRADRIDPTTGERVGVFHGFGLLVDTVPPGARVLVAGEEMGVSPLLTSVACRHGEDVLVRAELGRQAASVRTRCRKDVLVKLALVLRSGR
jgi:hypothetical protein